MTMGLHIPASGLSLRAGEQPGDATKPSQIMRLNLVQSTLDELIENLRGDQPVRVRLGKHPSLHYSGKSHSFHAYPETHRSEIYRTSDDKQNLYFAGVLSHSLEVEKAKKATAATDQALANLEESLNAFERGKESKKTHLIQHPDDLRALKGSSSKARGPKSKVDLDRDRLLRTTANRSLTSSPNLGPPKSPVPIPTPTSAPASQTKNNARLDALKTPFIHLLAVRAVSTKFLTRQTRSSIEDCSALAQKYGIENRLNREKFDLKDKSYKDLDVWKFPYPTQEDRQQAIDNAVSAFDRMRISRNDQLWQMLLSKEERGKGKCLSRLNLSTGPIKKPAPPRIQVDGADDKAKEGDATGNETDRGTAPRSFASTSKPRADKDGPKRTTKPKNNTATANNSTLTGRVTKKMDRKAPPKIDGKFKSDEFVHDSDDDDEEMHDAAPSPPASSQRSQRPKEAKPAPPKKAPVKKSQPPTKLQPQAGSAASKVPKSEAPPPKLEPSQSAKTSSKRPPSRPSTSPQKPSPQKPSPLGSSPPTNASDPAKRNRSDSHNQSSSSSSSSPLISQLARANKPHLAARPPKPTAPTNGVTKSSAANPLKRKAEPERVATPNSVSARTAANLEHKRRRGISTSSGGSTGSASPPMSQELQRQQLRDKSQKFKHYYAKYRSLHDTLQAHANPPKADLELLQKQHVRLQRMKREIWDEDRRLQDGIIP